MELEGGIDNADCKACAGKVLKKKEGRNQSSFWEGESIAPDLSLFLQEKDYIIPMIDLLLIG